MKAYIDMPRAIQKLSSEKKKGKKGEEELPTLCSSFFKVQEDCAHNRDDCGY